MIKSPVGIALLLSLCAAPTIHPQGPILIINGVRIEKCDGGSGSDPLRLSDIDRAAIENVEVIKGAAAIQQYGAGAINGVIHITTKKGSMVSPTVCGAPMIAGADAFTALLYSPELVMAHQDAIRLNDRQRTAIQDAVKAIQSKAIVDTQFKLALATEKVRAALGRSSIDETAVLQQIDDILALERDVKRAQMTLLVRIKNQLTAEQRAQLDKLR